jgi:hypothetical protein
VPTRVCLDGARSVAARLGKNGTSVFATLLNLALAS